MTGTSFLCVLLSDATFSCLALPRVLVLMNLLDPGDFETVEIHRGQRAAPLWVGTFPITAADTVDTVDSGHTDFMIPCWVCVSLYRWQWGSIINRVDLRPSCTCAEDLVVQQPDLFSRQFNLISYWWYHVRTFFGLATFCCIIQVKHYGK